MTRSIYFTDEKYFPEPELEKLITTAARRFYPFERLGVDKCLNVVVAMDMNNELHRIQMALGRYCKNAKRDRKNYKLKIQQGLIRIYRIK